MLAPFPFPDSGCFPWRLASVSGWVGRAIILAVPHRGLLALTRCLLEAVEVADKVIASPDGNYATARNIESDFNLLSNPEIREGRWCVESLASSDDVEETSFLIFVDFPAPRAGIWYTHRIPPVS